MTNEVSELAARCRSILDIMGRSRQPNQGAPGTEEALRVMRDAVEECARKGRLSQLRLAARDLEGLARDLEPDLRAEVDALLAAEGKGDLEHSSNQGLAEIRSIVARGRIGSATEYSALRGWYDNADTEEERDLKNEVELLLFEYERDD